MLSKVKGFGLVGIKGFQVDVETDIRFGLPGYDIVGLPDASVRESKDRVRTAIKNSGYNFPVAKVLVNLAPADLRKEGPIFDLSIAVGVLKATDIIRNEEIGDIVFLGELALNGDIRKINGILPILISAKEIGVKKFVLPFGNANEASFIEGLDIYAVRNLQEVVELLNGERHIDKLETKEFSASIEDEENSLVDFKYIKGQFSAKRAMEIAAAGGHNILMVGPPGSGKTMLAKAFPTILPDMTFEEALEVTKIHSVTGDLDSTKGIITHRPFRSPHHTATQVALTGGGRNATPGEISLAHNGILFLDELPEYNRKTLETLRQPLEDGSIMISRVNEKIEYPAKFTLVASMNPCPCGYRGSRAKPCVCTDSQVHKYLSKLSGPLMDRIDLHIAVDSIDYKDLTDNSTSEDSKSIRKRVNSARKIQTERFKKYNIFSNSQMSNQLIKRFCALDAECEKMMELAFQNLKLTARAYTRILKVARTIADLDGEEHINSSHLLEAINYRVIDEKEI